MENIDVGRVETPCWCISLLYYGKKSHRYLYKCFLKVLFSQNENFNNARFPRKQLPSLWVLCQPHTRVFSQRRRAVTMVIRAKLGGCTNKNGQLKGTCAVQTFPKRRNPRNPYICYSTTSKPRQAFPNRGGSVPPSCTGDVFDGFVKNDLPKREWMQKFRNCCQWKFPRTSPCTESSIFLRVLIFFWPSTGSSIFFPK